MKNQIFNLETIREIMAPIARFESKIGAVESVNKEINNKSNIFKKSIADVNIIESFRELIEKLKLIGDRMIRISEINLNKFISFNDLLINKYKEEIEDKLKEIQISPEKTKRLGLKLIESKKISTIISNSSYISSIPIYQWIRLLDSLTNNSVFLDVIKKVETLNETLIDKKLEIELSKIPKNVDKKRVDRFQKQFRNEPLSFEKFIQEFEKDLSRKELKRKEKTIQESKDQKKLEALKEKQHQQQQSYKDYLKYSEKEFQRRLRRKKRTKLADIAEEPKIEREISEEVSEKIERFKSKFDHKFRDELLIKRDDDTNPLELIRERKRKKHKEYKDFIDRMENKE